MVSSEAVRQRLDAGVRWADRHIVAGTALRVVREMLSVDVRDRIFGMTGQAFLSLIPILIIFSTAISEGDGESIAALVNSRLGLSGATAETVKTLFTNPVTTGTSASFISAALLLLSLNSFTRTMRRSVERPWGLSKSGVRGQFAGLLGVLLLIVMFPVLVAVGSDWLPGGAVATATVLLLKIIVAGGFWLAITYVLSTGRISPRHLWPGALAGGIAQTGAGWWTVTFLPEILAKDASRYGVIGVALAILSWLVVQSGITVGVGVMGAQIARAAGWLVAPTPDLDRPLLKMLSPFGTAHPSAADAENPASATAPVPD